MVYLKDADKMFEAFLREKQFLGGASKATIRIYGKAWEAFKKYVGCTCEIREDKLKAFVINSTLEGTLKVGSINTYSHSVNSFFSWLIESGHTDKHLKIPPQSIKKKVLKTYSQEEVIKIISYKPKRSTGKRLMVILSLLIDTGSRVNEVLTLSRKNIDWDNLSIILKGKGDKERRVPISIEMRKILYRWLQTHNHDLVFCSPLGTKLRYDNLRRDFLKLLDSIGIEKSEGSFHAFRRYFGKHYTRNGGNLIYLQQILGHSSLEITKRYVEVNDEDLRIAHKSLSPLEKLKRRP